MSLPQLASSRATTDFAEERGNPALPVLLEFRSPAAGVIAAPVPRFVRGTSWIVASLFFAIMVATGTISVDQVVTAHGEVIAKAPALVVQPLDSAIVRSIDVHVGESVHKGELLARLDPTFAAADLDALASEVASLRALETRLRAEAAGRDFSYDGPSPDLALQAAVFAERRAEYDYRLRGYRESIAGARAEIARARSDVAGYRERLAVATEVERMRAEL